jgi:putative ABC transport system ATP-binding protein
MAADVHNASNHAGSHRKALSPARRLFALLQPERSDIATIVVLSFISGLLYLATPLTVDAVVNNIAFGGEQQVYLQALVVLALALLFLLILVAMVRAVQDFAMELIQRRLFIRLTADLAYRLPRVRMDALDQQQGPELINRFFDVITVQKSASALLLDGVNVLFSTVIGLIVLGFYHPTLLLFAFVLFFVLIGIVIVPARPAVRTSIRESYAKHAVVGWLEQIAMYPTLFKGSGAADLACQRADGLAQEYLRSRRAHFRILISQVISLLAVQAIASASLLTLGGWLVLRGELTLGQLVASELIVAAIVAAMSKLGKHLESWYDALAAVDKLGYLVDLPIEHESGEDARAHRGGMSVALRDLTFGYDSALPVLHHLSIQLEPGARVALFSAAGQGASTLLDLLMGLRFPANGMVMLDGMDLRHWRLEDLRGNIALVRGHEIVEGTVAENVRLGRSDLGLDVVQDALERVGLLPAIHALPDGLNTLLKAGGRPLSSSQRSQLMLARALVSRPRLLLIDELLDGLDVALLQRLNSQLFDRVHPWTMIVVTRDPDIMKQCDQVVTLGACHASKPQEGSSTPTPA